MKSLLVSLGTGDDAKSAQAARALTAVICGTPALQENLLVAGGAPILVKQLCAPAGEPSLPAQHQHQSQGQCLPASTFDGPWALLMQLWGQCMHVLGVQKGA